MLRNGNVLTGRALDNDTTPRKSKLHSLRVLSWHLTLCLLLLSLAALSSAVCPLNHAPIFVALPASRYHQRTIAIVTLVAVLLTCLDRLKRIKTSIVLILLSVHALCIQIVAGWSWSRFDRLVGPVAASIGREVCQCLPFVVGSLLIIAQRITALARREYGRTGPPALLTSAVSGITFVLMEKQASETIPELVRTSIFINAALQPIIAGIYALACPWKARWGILTALYFAMLLDSHMPLPWSKIEHSPLLSKAHFTVLERKQSLTGYVSVLENTRDQYRVLRCDHSLLGGIWMPTVERVQDGIVVAEPVFPVFTTLEAVRLIESIDPSQEDTAPQPSALIM